MLKGQGVSGIGSSEVWRRLHRLAGQLHEETSDVATRKLVDELRDVIEAADRSHAFANSDRWRLLFDAAPVAYVVTDLPGMIEAANRSALELLAIRSRIDRDTPLVRQIARPDRPLLQRLLRSDCAASAAPIVVGTREGARVEIHCVSVGSDRLLWTMHDVSEAEHGRELLEEAVAKERAAAEQLRAVDSMRRAFLLAVSHDLRSPLVAMAEYSSLLQDDRLDDQQRSRALDRLRTTAHDTIAMLNGLLDYERIEHAAVAVRRDDVDVAVVIRRVLNAIPADRHTVRADLPSTCALVDATIVERIITNLVSNAIQHTPAGSTVWVACRREPEGVHLAVEDNGPGIPAEHRHAVFDLFHRHQSGDRTGGLGIGLALVRRFAQLHGGYARADARLGGGASIQVLLSVDT